MKYILPLLLCLCMACKKSSSPVTPADVLTGDLCNARLYGFRSIVGGHANIDQVRLTGDTSISSTPSSIGGYENYFGIHAVIRDGIYYTACTRVDTTRKYISLDRIDIKTGVNNNIPLPINLLNIDYNAHTNSFFGITDHQLVSFIISGSIITIDSLASIPTIAPTGCINTLTDITVDPTNGTAYLLSRNLCKAATSLMGNTTLYKYDGTTMSTIREYSEYIYCPRFNQNDGKLYCFGSNNILAIDPTSGNLSHLASLKYSGYYSSAVIEPCNNVYIVTSCGDFTSQTSYYYGIYNCGNHKLYYTSNLGEEVYLGLTIAQ